MRPATVHVHIERVVVDSGELQPADARALARALSAELERQLAHLPPPAAAADDRLTAAPVPAAAWRSAATLGSAAAASLIGVLGHDERTAAGP